MQRPGIDVSDVVIYVAGINGSPAGRHQVWVIVPPHRSVRSRRAFAGGVGSAIAGDADAPTRTPADAPLVDTLIGSTLTVVVEGAGSVSVMALGTLRI
ncbi:MAG: hypothetical protein VYE68_04350 [Acidobacteriota bacterium]|nr:hypothetical protein [Acidobacteriota bacterium]